MNIRIHKLPFYALLFCVYGVFFSVESFYNFEGQPTAFGGQLNAKDVSAHSVVKGAPLHSSSSPSFRLNKRYHQEDIPPCPVFSPATPERCITPVRFASPWDGALPSVAIIHNSLRGPPAAA